MSRKVIDLTGKRFGRLTVLYQIDNIISVKGVKRTNWHCICDCGTECNVAGDNLRKGNTKSCGCLRKEKGHQAKFKDLTGQKFGRLIVLYENTTDPRNEKCKYTIWRCKCECGNECDVIGSNLIKGATKSCGCLQKETVSNRSTKDIRQYDEFGNVIKKLCPCCQQWLPLNNYQKHKPSKDGYASVCKTCSSYRLTSRYSFYKSNAKVRGLIFNLSLEDFNDITKEPCYYCGGYNGKFDSVPFSGVDRIDSNKGYVQDNVIPCCEVCNKMKNNLSQDVWIQHMQKILNHLGVIGNE